MKPLRIVFAGSPWAAVPSLHAIAGTQHEVVAVVTRESSPIGRKRVLTPTPVAQAANDLNLNVIEANRLTEKPTELISSLSPDIGVIVAYGGLVREPLLSAPRLGWINLHFSLLPRWRGAAPVQRAVMAGDDVTGACVFQLQEELDSGPVYGMFTQGIGRNETAGHVLESLAEGGAHLLVNVIDMIADGSATAEEQVGDIVVAPKLTLEDGRINWALPAPVVHQRIRGVTPEPGAFTTVDGVRFKILDAVVARDAPTQGAGVIHLAGSRVLVGTTSDPLHVITVQPAGKKPMDAVDWWRGRQHEGELVAQ